MKKSLFLIAAALAVVAAGSTAAFLALRSRSDEKASLKPGRVPEDGTLSVSADPPCSGVEVSAASNIQKAIDANPAGTTFCIASGTHRLMNPLEPKDDQRFIGRRGAVISGASAIQSWKREGDAWVAAGQAQESPQGPDRCAGGRQECRFQEDVFFGDLRLDRVLDLTKLSSGKFYFDYRADKIFVADDPRPHQTEVATAPAGFVAGGNRVHIESLVIEKFANPGGGQGAIDAKDAVDWTISGVTVRLNHGRGVTLGQGTRLMGSKLIRNGQLGAGGTPKKVLIQGNEFGFNNELDFSGGFAAGGLKAGEAEQVEIADNFVHDNRGSGIWLDEESRDVTVRKNRVIQNFDSGIHYEISCRGRILENEVAHNGFRAEARQGRGGGIQIVASHDVEVLQNTVRDNNNGITVLGKERGTGGDCRRRTSNVTVRSNQVSLGGSSPGGRTTLQRVGLWDADDPLETIAVSFEANVYCLAELGGDHFYWADAISRSQWQAKGHDDTSEAKFSRGRC